MIDFWFDRATNLLVYPLTAGAPLEHLPDAQQVADKYFTVPRTLRSCQVLRWYRYPVEAIIDDSYPWPIQPGRHALWHQKIMANFAVMHPRSFNLSDMGTMKTLATLWAADWLMRQHKPGSFRAVIASPLSTLERVWGDAIFSNFLHNRTFKILHGSEDKRLELLSEPADFYIVNHDGLKVGASVVHRKGVQLNGFAKALAERADIQLAVIDEVSAFKDGTTARSRIARQVICKRPYLWCLTGTPTPNAPTDAYGLALAVNGAFGKSFTGFRNETMTQLPHSQFKWIPKRDGYEKARELLSPAIRFDIGDIWDGPELTTQQRQVELTPQQQAAMKELKKELTLTMKDGGSVDAINEAAMRTKFLQISAGAVYDDAHKAHRLNNEPRMQALCDTIEQSSGKVVVFAGLTSVVDMVYEALKDKWPCAVVNGSTSQKQRNIVFSDFQEREAPHVLIADPGTMAHGIDLYAGRTAIWVTPTDKNELYLQGNKRLHRPGQKYPVTVVQIVSNKLELEIYRRLETQTALQGALLDAVRVGEL